MYSLQSDDIGRKFEDISPNEEEGENELLTITCQ